MSGAMKSIKIVKFQDNKKKYGMSARNFMSLAASRKYCGMLNGKVKVPHKS